MQRFEKFTNMETILAVKKVIKFCLVLDIQQYCFVVSQKSNQHEKQHFWMVPMAEQRIQ